LTFKSVDFIFTRVSIAWIGVTLVYICNNTRLT
jgi:hypothetical protein